MHGIPPPLKSAREGQRAVVDHRMPRNKLSAAQNLLRGQKPAELDKTRYSGDLEMDRISPFPMAHLPPMRERSFARRASFPIVLATVAYIFDVITPNGLLDGVLYVSVILVCVWLPRPKSALFTALGLMPLTMLGFALSPSGAVTEFANRCVGVGIIWLAAIAVRRSVSSTQDKQSALRDLEERLRAAERTASQERSELSAWIRAEIAPELQILEWRLHRLLYCTHQKGDLRDEAMILSRAIRRASKCVRAREFRLRRRDYCPPAENSPGSSADFDDHAP